MGQISTKTRSARWTLDLAPLRLDAIGCQCADINDVMTRIVSLMIAVPAVVLLSPLFVLIAVAVRLSGPGPILYKGARVGKNQRVFTIRKFRTMIPGAEARIGARLAVQEDDVETPVGRVLRHFKLDELFQFFNVIAGDMELVGPRPVRPVFLPTFLREIPGYTLRFQVPPGITGLAQVRAGYYISPRNKLRYELLYIRRRSPYFNLVIMAYTVRMFLGSLFGMHKRLRWSVAPGDAAKALATISSARLRHES